LFCLVGAQDEAATPAPQADPTAAPGPEWGGCVDPDPENKDALVTIGKKTTICLVIADGVDWAAADERTYMRLHFQPKADDYSRFHVPLCKIMTVAFVMVAITCVQSLMLTVSSFLFRFFIQPSSSSL
jgi:hypothetical protein